MAQIYTDVIASVQGLPDGSHIDYVCPAGTRWVVRDIGAASGSSGSIPELHFEDLVTGGTWALLIVGGLILESTRWEGRQVFNYGGGFRVRAENNPWDYRVTAFVFDVP